MATLNGPDLQAAVRNPFEPRRGSFHHFTRLFIAGRGTPEPTARNQIADDAPVWPWHELGQAVTIPSYVRNSQDEYFSVDQLSGDVAVPVRWDHEIRVETLDAYRKMLRSALDCSLAVISRVNGINEWVYVPRARMMDPPRATYDPSIAPPWTQRPEDREFVQARWQIIGPPYAVMHRDGAGGVRW